MSLNPTVKFTNYVLDDKALPDISNASRYAPLGSDASRVQIDLIPDGTHAKRIVEWITLNAKGTFRYYQFYRDNFKQQVMVIRFELVNDAILFKLNDPSTF